MAHRNTVRVERDFYLMATGLLESIRPFLVKVGCFLKSASRISPKVSVAAL